jgi:hypothetical protein
VDDDDDLGLERDSRQRERQQLKKGGEVKPGRPAPQAHNLSGH